MANLIAKQNAITMKSRMNSWVILLPVLGFIACNGNTNAGPGSIKAAREENANKLSQKTDSASGGPSDSTKIAVTVTRSDADFMVNAAEGNILEERLGRLAEQRADNERVKQFGAMMIKDHSQGREQLKALAARENIAIPSGLGDTQRDELDKLEKLTGSDFDKAYMKMMVKDHMGDVDAFQKEAGNGSDPGVTALASQMLPVLQKHLDSAKAINDALK